MILQAGDILLWRITQGAPWLARLIAWGERKTGQVNSDKVNYYHAAIMGPDCLHYYEADIPSGVTNTILPDVQPSYIEVFRFINPLSQNDLSRMFLYANSQLGTGYNYVGVLTAGFFEIAGKPFCSELVWRICTYADRVICPWDSCLSPDDIAASSALERSLK